MIRVRSGSRLHFGVFSFGGDASKRFFGGVGMMVQEPALIVSVRSTSEWSAEGPGAERALVFAQKFASSYDPGVISPHHLHVESLPTEHSGLGSGTQLGMAVARAMAESANTVDRTPTDLAARIGRGLRSALGIHGFTQGGFLVEGGKHVGEAISPLVARVDFPSDWRLVLTTPAMSVGLHGPAEIEAFRQLQESGVPLPTDALCRLTLLGVLPALLQRDLPAFSEALFEFNYKVGEAFAAIQGGPYAGPAVAELVAFIRGQGVSGVAQSSWGPTVCAIVADEDRGKHLAATLQKRFSTFSKPPILTAARNEPACSIPSI